MGKMKSLIGELTEKNQVIIAPMKNGKEAEYDAWLTALKIDFDLSSDYAINCCSDLLTIAIGKLEDDINKSKRDKFTGELITTHKSEESYEVTSDKPNEKQKTKADWPAEKHEKSKYQKIWQWIDTHRILSILGAFAAIATIFGVIFAVLK